MDKLKHALPAEAKQVSYVSITCRTLVVWEITQSYSGKMEHQEIHLLPFNAKHLPRKCSLPQRCIERQRLNRSRMRSDC